MRAKQTPLETDHKEVVYQAKRINISSSLIYHLINTGRLSPGLNRAKDLAKLELLGESQRDRIFMRHLLSKYTKKERQDLCEYAGLTPAEVWLTAKIAALAEKGEEVVVSTICADYYSFRLRKKYDFTKPDRPLERLIKRIKKQTYNRKYYNRSKLENSFEWPEIEEGFGQGGVK